MASAKRRSSTESRDEEEKNTDSDSLVQVEDDNSKPAKRSPMRETTLQDLPIEMLECILVKAVAMEVMGMKLSRSVWIEKANLVISRLSSVSSQWSNVLATDFYRNELQKLLDSCGHKTIRLDIINQFPMQFTIIEITTLKDEVYMFSSRDEQDPFISVLNRNNFAVVTDVIPLPDGYSFGMAACKLSKCVYVGLGNENCDCDSQMVLCHCFSVLRITRDEDQNFNVSPWITNLKTPHTSISVTADGSVMFLTLRGGEDPDSISLYDTNGSLQHEIMLSLHIDEFGYGVDAIQKPNGNFLLAFYDGRCVLVEIDMSANIVRKYRSTVSYGECYVNYADAHGRIMVTGFYPFDGMEMFDAELNPLHFSNPLLTRGSPSSLGCLHYNSERNEVMCMVDEDLDSGHGLLTIFRFTEE